MIYCTTQELEKYSDTLDLEPVGLYTTYGHNPSLMNSVLLFTVSPFFYEEGTQLPVGERPAVVENDKLLTKTLDQKVKGKKVRAIVSKLSPLDIYSVFKDAEISHLKICKNYEHGSKALRMVLGSRAVAWTLNYRGPLDSSGNKIVNVQFGTPSLETLDSTMVMYYEELQKALKKGGGK